MCRKDDEYKTITRVTRRSFTRDDREFLLLKTRGRCGHCGVRLTGSTATVDHVVPIKNQGTNEERNLVCLCEKCNQEKGSRIVSPSKYYKYLNKESMKETLAYFNEYNYTAMYEHGNSFNKFTIMDEFSMFSDEMAIDKPGFISYLANSAGNSVYDFEFRKNVTKVAGYSIVKANYSHLDEIYRQYKSFLGKARVPLSYDKIKSYVHKQLYDAYLKGAVYFIKSKSDSILGWFTLRVVLVDNAKWELRLDNLVYKDALNTASYNKEKMYRCKVLNMMVYVFLSRICKEMGVKEMELRVSTPSVTLKAVAFDLNSFSDKTCISEPEDDEYIHARRDKSKDEVSWFFTLKVPNPYFFDSQFVNVLECKYSGSRVPEDYVDFYEEQSTKSFQTVLFEKFGKGLIHVYGYSNEIMA